HRFRHSSPWLFSVSRCLGPTQRRDPVHHLSGANHHPHPWLGAGPITASSACENPRQPLALNGDGDEPVCVRYFEKRVSAPRPWTSRSPIHWPLSHTRAISACNCWAVVRTDDVR